MPSASKPCSPASNLSERLAPGSIEKSTVLAPPAVTVVKGRQGVSPTTHAPALATETL